MLVVDDEASLRKVVSQVLTEDGHEVTTASSAEKAFSLFQEHPFPLVFSDIRMGNMSGIELLQRIKEHSPDTQVIIMTSNATADNTIAALRSGAYDYLLKPFEDIDLISKVANRAVDKVRLLEENSSLMKQLEQKNEELKKANSVLKERSLYDELTELYNARFFQELLKLEIAQSTRFRRTFSLLLIDVDHFASYNKANGHAEGDKVLSMLASILVQGLRKVDVIVRYGGEEFVVLLPEIDGDKALGTAEKIRAYIANYPFPKSESQP
ncbi:MAG: diguanylate cyclase, partial [Nitrospirae bacterium]|nr:diguanylate cyclase [Nitrospirota bacterium]